MTAADVLLDRALVEEATKKSGLVWVRGSGPARALWHVWHEGAAVLVGDGPGEQPLPAGLEAGAAAEVTVRSKDKGGRIVAWTAEVAVLAPHSEEWEAAVGELKGKRLNAPDAERLTERWARECRVVRLTPGAADIELPRTSLAAVPLPTTATTRRPVPAALPRLLLKRRRKS
ncbi:MULTISPECIES: hypothetical protein [unclassified Streptomyces]|uniref:hypothetical protein n=1 Tax=unclassified Streptomyces TaxID=2593676 RepID=UPI0001C18B97|nr:MULTISPECIES: hypothetical protein [unclassified Streptomyces]AEN12221.1 conserved hypothetical protein [Streptomyces sp. SirexAA-E]MYR68074.1 hypothetical protein [Streptomyces sp. SID4939]MYS04282.1 hypothetical protein [Streptomyces sp. SID4940]MYT63238.1 hypothetical protein [Streptomyces sp. SID8357]MYT88486.1 hypothetical protein [Streptomyces sp. SID8360]